VGSWRRRVKRDWKSSPHFTSFWEEGSSGLTLSLLLPSFSYTLTLWAFWRVPIPGCNMAYALSQGVVSPLLELLVTFLGHALPCGPPSISCIMFSYFQLALEIGDCFSFCLFTIRRLAQYRFPKII
jgi:hypothetical protein